MSSRLFHQLDMHARSRPETIAVREHGPDGVGPSLTWAQLHAATTAFAEQLRHTTADDAVVMLSMPGRVQYVVALLASLLADRVVFPVSPDLTTAEITAAAAEARVGAVVGQPAALATLASVVPIQIGAEQVPLRGMAGTAATHAGRGALLLQSSGTTGLPKIVRRDMRSLDAVAQNCAVAVGLTEQDRMLLSMPIHHSYGLEHGVLSTVLSGAATVLCPWASISNVSAPLASERITVLPGVPALFEMLIRTDAQAPSLRVAYSAGATLPPRIADAFAQRYGIGLAQIYGATELGSVTFNDPASPDFDPMNVGRLLPGVDIRILDIDQPRINQTLPTGVEGQVAVSAPSMFSGYVNEIEPATLDGYFLTGDLGALDKHHRLRITGRLKLLVDVGGLKVNPQEVEMVLAQHPAVREAVVVPLQQSDTASRLRALVVPIAEGMVDTEELRRFAREQLSPHKVPRVFEIHKSLPRSATGKVLRRAVQCL